MQNETKTDQLLRGVIDELLREHPLPWTVDQDWAYEVIARDGALIAKFQKARQAQELVDFAQNRKAEIEKNVRKLEEYLASPSEAAQ